MRMKTILILSFLFSFSFSQEGIEKKIKTETKYHYSVEQQFGNDVEILKSKIINKYDSNNNLIEESEFNSEGKLRKKYYFLGNR